MHLAEPGSICSAWVHDLDEAGDVLKSDIRVGDLLRTDIDRPYAPGSPARGTHDNGHPERMVLVLSLETLHNEDQSGYVVVLDSGVRTEISCVWLWPGDQSLDLYYR